MFNFCTLFDANYLTRGLALYESLCQVSFDFHIYCFAFDDGCYKMLKKLNLNHATVISLSEFEDEELLSIKTTRSRMEYCWTCTPSIIRYALNKYNLESCTYLDADLYFWGSPEVLFEEISNKSVMITGHRYTPRYDRTSKSGKYCVQFMTFRNDGPAKRVLDWWRDACNAWCYSRHEDGKFGDQKYLDDWPEKFEAVHVLQHPGGGVAPWNVQQYEIFRKKDNLFGRTKDTGGEFELIFYHFHHIAFYSNGQIDMGGYTLSKNTKKLIYKPYVEHLEKIKIAIQKVDNSFLKIHGDNKLSFNNWKGLARYIKHSLLFNVVDKNNFLKSC
jgi:hypothetical protein